MGPFHVGIAVFVFLAIATIAGVIGDYKKREAAIAPLRAAIERGQPIDPQVVEKLLAPEPQEEGLNPLHLKVGGIITIASGMGVAVLSLLTANFGPLAQLRGSPSATRKTPPLAAEITPWPALTAAHTSVRLQRQPSSRSR
jgi:hypothetical protein